MWCACIYNYDYTDIVRHVLPVQPTTREGSEASEQSIHSSTTTEDAFVGAHQQRMQYGGCKIITTIVGSYAPPQICRKGIYSQHIVVYMF